jgi:hypothetical protein
VPDSAPSGWDRFFSKFHCSKCNGDEAYHSRPRGLLEKYLLPLLLLKPVRCEHCYHRVYVFRSVSAQDRPVYSPKPVQHQSAKASAPGQRIA